MFIYVLELDKHKYYIGKSNNYIKRIDDHKTNRGSYWTKLYNPVKIIEVFESTDDFDEDKTTLKYMNLYGIDNVRGGSFVQSKLSKENIEILQRMINSKNDTCFKCGLKGHFIKDCPNKYKCMICGRNEHITDNCKETIDINGLNI